MSIKEAVQILMLSPFFFRLSVAERKELIEEFLELVGKKDAGSNNGCILGYD